MRTGDKIMELKYRDPVKIVLGFYKGLEGIVVRSGEVKDHYYVDMIIIEEDLTLRPSAWIHIDNLEKINE